MPTLPLTAYWKRYGGGKEHLRVKAAEEAKTAQRIADYVNGLIADNPSELQQYYFATIARDLGVTVDQVRSAISDGGYNGITIGVRAEERWLLERYRTSSKP